MRSAVTVAVLILFSLAVTPAGAASPGVLRGVVADPSGAPISHAQLALTSSAKAELKAESDDAGQFAFAGVAAGKYLLTARAQGFQDAALPVEVGAVEGPAQRVRMKIAIVAEEMTVTAEAADPVSADGNIGAIQVDHDLLKSLPVKEGDPLAVASLFVDAATTGVEGVKIVVDGVETSALDVPSTSVKRVTVNRNPYSAEFGRPGKGRIEVSTRPGSLHRIHHRAILTYRNSALDAKTAFASVKPPMQRQLYELEMDGPLPHNKGTFYVGGEYLYDKQSSVVNATKSSLPITANVNSPERNGRVMARADLRLTPLHTLSLSYNLNRDSRENQGVGGYDLPERAFNANNHAQEARISEVANLSASFSNEVRFAFKRRVSDAFGLSSAPAVLVSGAFHGGGAQLANQQKQDIWEVQELATAIHGKHTFRFGGTAKRHHLDIMDADNFGGTYSFPNQGAFDLNQPVFFAINRGNPRVWFQQNEFSYFLQDELRLRPNLDLMLGLRHELQSNLRDHNNLAPRVGLSYAPGSGNTVLRAGAGIFYERQPWSMEKQVLLYDGAAHITQIVVQNPSFPQPVPVVFPPSVVQITPGARTPYALQASLGVERKLSASSYLSVDYTMLRGVKLYRTRDVNAPLPSTGLRPDPNFILVDRFEAAGGSHANSLSVNFRTSLRKRFELLSQYTFSRSSDDTSGMFFHPANNYDLTGEYGRSDFDRRHRFNLATIFYLPWELKFGAIAQLSSGIPFNITTGADLNHDLVNNDRPPGVSRNTGNGPGFAGLDLRLSRRFKLRKDDKAPYVELRLDGFNVLNHVNAISFTGNEQSAFFGRANSAYPARQLQASIKFSF